MQGVKHEQVSFVQNSLLLKCEIRTAAAAAAAAAGAAAALSRKGARQW
jgi:hypothetical protein